MFEYWSTRNYLDGIHLWDWKVEPNAGGLTNTDYTPQNKPAKQVLISSYEQLVNQTGDIHPAPVTDFLINEHVATNIGTQIYTDRTYVITKLPSILNDSKLIKTKNADKYNKQNEYMSVIVTGNATLLVAFDNRAQKIPQWLESWELTSDTITTSDTSFKLYKKVVTAGTTNLGGNAVDPMVGAKSNYFVIVTGPVDFDNAAEIPVETIPADDSSIPTSAQPTDGIIVEYPENNSIVTGEKKIKIYDSKLSLDKYIATWEVDNQGQELMENAVTGDFKQAKINFDAWTWNGAGPYNVVLRTLDLYGIVTDTAQLTLYIK